MTNNQIILAMLALGAGAGLGLGAGYLLAASRYWRRPDPRDRLPAPWRESVMRRYWLHPCEAN